VAKFKKFPVIFAVSREFGMETGSHLTAHTTIESSQTAHFVGDSKKAVSAGISPVSSPDILSLWTSAVSGADFWPPVSASKNSVPGSGISRGKGLFGGWKSGILGGKNAVSSRGRNYCGFNPRASNCRLQSAGASRSRSTPMPRGKRPSTAALTRSGARNASEMVMLT
jgi:hypothetical protein